MVCVNGGKSTNLPCVSEDDVEVAEIGLLPYLPENEQRLYRALLYIRKKKARPLTDRERAFITRMTLRGSIGRLMTEGGFVDPAGSDDAKRVCGLLGISRVESAAWIAQGVLAAQLDTELAEAITDEKPVIREVEPMQFDEPETVAAAEDLVTRLEQLLATGIAENGY